MSWLCNTIYSNTIMKENYPTKTYRLNKKTIKNLEEIKKDLGISYNMLFTRFINKYKQSK